MTTDSHITGSADDTFSPEQLRDLQLQALRDQTQAYHNKLTHIHTLTPIQRQEYTAKLELAEEQYQKLTHTP